VYLVDRKNQYSGDAMGELTEKSVIKISSFDEVKE